jgi:hypothetical protein
MTAPNPFDTSEPMVETWVARSVPDILDALLRPLRTVGRPAIVAIDGRSGSGKTTVAHRFAEAHPGACVVSTDDVAWHHSFFGWDELLATNILEPTRAGRPVAYRPPAWDARDRPGSIDVPAGTTLLLLEGVGAARLEFSTLLDAIVWVQSDAIEARRRGLERDGGDAAAEAFWDEWQAEEIPFLETQRPWARAELIVCGTPNPRFEVAGAILVAPHRPD